jgi:hypothetical protein
MQATPQMRLFEFHLLTYSGNFTEGDKPDTVAAEKYIAKGRAWSARWYHNVMKKAMPGPRPASVKPRNIRTLDPV